MVTLTARSKSLLLFTILDEYGVQPRIVWMKDSCFQTINFKVLFREKKSLFSIFD